MFAQVKGALVLDAGNALFRAPGLTDEGSKQRAAFIVKQMGALGTRAMAPGVKDLNLGVGFLAAQAKAAGVQVLSANLMKGEARAFAAGAVFTVNGVKVGVLGLSPEGTFGDARGAPLVASIERELGLLEGVDLKVVLAAVPYDAALKLAETLGPKVDLVIQSEGGRGALPAQPVKDNFVLPSGIRGQAVGRLDVEVRGKGALVDEGGTGRTHTELAFLDRQLEILGNRIKVTKDAAGRKALQQTDLELRRRRAQMQREADASNEKGARSFRLDWKVLDKSIVDEPAMKAKVLKIEPTYAGAH